MWTYHLVFGGRNVDVIFPLADCGRAIGVAQYNCLENDQSVLFFNSHPANLFPNWNLKKRTSDGQLDWVGKHIFIHV